MAYKLSNYTSKIHLFKVPFNEDDNYILGGNKSQISQYFQYRGGYTISSVQPPKIERNIKYILQLPDELVNQFTNILPNQFYDDDVDNLKKLFNYCKFDMTFNYYDEAQESTNATSGIVFYFIKGIKWKSTQTIELDLQMDVLNTLNYLNAPKSDGTQANHYFTNGDK